MNKIKGIFLISLFYVSHVTIAQHWEGVGGGTDQVPHIVYTLINFNNLLVLGGAFDSLGIPAIYSQGTGYWNNQQWFPGNTSFVTGLPKCYIKYDNQLVMGGGFGEVNGNSLCKKIAHFDSAGWSPLGSGVTSGSVVNCMAVYNGDLFIGGQFTQVDSTIAAWRIARWDGAAWHAMGSGITGGFGVVNDMAVFQNELYVCGFFSTVDGLYAPGICRWNGTNWDTLGSGILGAVKCMFVDSVSNRLYVGGQFGVAGGVSCPTGVAYWDGANWFPVGTNPYIPAVDLIVYNGILYNTSTQYYAVNSNGDTIKYIAWYDGVNWNPVPGGLSSTGNCFAIYQNELYVGGYFQYAGDSLVNGIAKWIPGTLGIHEVKSDKLHMQIVPNPAKEDVMLQLDFKKQMMLNLIITNIEGKKIEEINLSGNGKIIHHLNTSGLKSGVYIFSVNDGNELLSSEKIIISR
ncbi:MAG TPA: T9SS type A sorting domain-containing protein [Bacteroidia bacterium]|nr:T9SS type A sorting domain-containing protein [Bacteroidia bacterium]